MSIYKSFIENALRSCACRHRRCHGQLQPPAISRTQYWSDSPWPGWASRAVSLAARPWTPGPSGCSGSDSTAASRRRPASSWSARWRRRPRRDQRRRPCPHRGNGHPRAGRRAWLSAASAPGSDHRPGRKHALQRTVGRRHGHAGYRRLGRHRGTPGLGRTVVRLHVTVTSGQNKAQSDRGLRCHRQSGRPLRYHRPENHPASRQVRTARSGPARRRYAQPAPSKR